MASTRYARNESGNVKRHHTAGWAVLAVIFVPAALCAWMYANQEKDTLPLFCAQARIVPQEYLCTDMQKCDRNAFILSAATIQTNRQTRAWCPDAPPDMLMVIPEEVLHPTEETQAKVMAAFGLLSEQQREAVLLEAYEAREAFKGEDEMAQGGPE